MMVEASLSSSSAMTTVTNAKFEVEKFNGTNNFGMWQCEVFDVLCQQELDYIHSDVWEPIKTAFLGCMHYFVTFVYDYSRKVWVYLIRTRIKFWAYF